VQWFYFSFVEKTSFCACFPAASCNFPEKDVSGSLHHCSGCKRKMFGPCCSLEFEANIPVYCRFCQNKTSDHDETQTPNQTDSAPKIPSFNIQMIEDTADFMETGNPYSSNHPIFTSAEDTFNFLHGFDAERVHSYNFNGGQTSFRLEKRIGIQPANGVRFFECLPGKQGCFDNREYYGYDTMVGFCSPMKRKGYICPSIVVSADFNGVHKDTGMRALCFLRTRCIRPRFDAIMYSVITGKVEKLVNVFGQHLNGNLYTAWHVPFEFDNGIKE